MKIEQIKIYEDDPNVTLTAYLLDDSEEMLNGDSRPAILICPGGGFLFSSDREAEPIALRFSAMGYHTFVLKYSVYSNSGIMFPNSNDPILYKKSIFPNPIREIGKAMLIINNHADEWKIKADQIILSGYSAGAANCALYSVNWNKPVITEYFNEPIEKLKPAAAILGYGVYDYFLINEKRKHITDKWQQTLSDAANYSFLGKTELEENDLTPVSAARLVDKDTPPMFLWATRDDNVVSVQQTTAMAHSLAMNNIPFESHIYERGQHGLALANQSTAKSKMDVVTEVAQWINLAESWLIKRFPLALPDETPIFDFNSLIE